VHEKTEAKEPAQATGRQLKKWVTHRHIKNNWRTVSRTRSKRAKEEQKLRKGVKDADNCNRTFLSRATGPA